METRALAIAFFYAVGTAAGGISGPLLFGHLIGSGEASQVALGMYIGAATMALGGIAELAFGVKAEQTALEDVAKPLTAEEAEEGEGERRSLRARSSPPSGSPRSRRRRSRRSSPPAGASGSRSTPAARAPAGVATGPAPALSSGSPGMATSVPVPAQQLDREIDIIERALDGPGPGTTRPPRRARRRPLLGPGSLRASAARGRRLGRGCPGLPSCLRAAEVGWRRAELLIPGRQFPTFEIRKSGEAPQTGASYFVGVIKFRGADNR